MITTFQILSLFGRRDQPRAMDVLSVTAGLPELDCPVFYTTPCAYLVPPPTPIDNQVMASKAFFDY